MTSVLLVIAATFIVVLLDALSPLRRQPDCVARGAPCEAGQADCAVRFPCCGEVL